jgi:hypothetical protein
MHVIQVPTITPLNPDTVLSQARAYALKEPIPTDIVTIAENFREISEDE